MARANKINTLYVFTVEGSSVFPFDMLRYDACWPKYEADTPKMDSFSNRTASKSRRVITMVGLKNPTEARWNSFGWRVTDVAVRSVG